MPQASKVALVTGAGRGIGEATAARLSSEGYTTIALDASPPELFAERGWEVHQCDVSDEEAVRSVIAEVEARHGRVDVLCNVAGIVLVKPLTETTWSEFRRLVEVNIGGTFLMCKYVLPLMQRQRQGVVVNLGSVSGHIGQIDHSLYGATKGAIIALGRALAWELAPYGIRMVSVSPGSVDTAMLRGDIELEARSTGESFQQVKARREKEQAFGRWADPVEIAEAISFLASDRASFITGCDLLVDGGWVAR